MRIDAFGAPAMVTWQLTRDCNLACLHCCTDSAPGRGLPGELTREALAWPRDRRRGRPLRDDRRGEPTFVPSFHRRSCKTLSDGGVLLKIETNGQNFDAERLSKALAIRSVQISIRWGDRRPCMYGKRMNGALESRRCLPRRPKPGPAPRDHFRAHSAQHIRGRGRHRPGPGPRGLPLQHRPTDAPGHGGQALGPPGAFAAEYADFLRAPRAKRTRACRTYSPGKKGPRTLCCFPTFEGRGLLPLI